MKGKNKMKKWLFTISMIFILGSMILIWMSLIPGTPFKNPTPLWELQTIGWVLNSLYFQMRDL